MSDETISTNTVKTASDGTVKIAVEKYNELLAAAAAKAPVINRTTVVKTPEILAGEHRAWGATFMGMGASVFVVGACLYKAGRSGS